MKKIILLLVMCFCLTALAACGRNKQADGSKIYNIYVVNKEETKIFSNEYSTKSTEQNDILQELLEQLSSMPDKLEYKAPLAGSFKLLDYALDGTQLILNFDEHYAEQPITTEILNRAAIVRTMTQIKDIDYVSFQVRTEPLTDNIGNAIGIMSSDMFIDNAGNQINAKEEVTIRLYFANKDGDKLVETNRKLEYSTNISMEKLIVEQLIKGPTEYVKNDAFPTINPDTKIIGVTVKDGICYVNFNESFMTQIYNVTSEVTLYSLSNSLVELPNVNKVQIAINGDTNVMFKEHTSFAVPFERNLDIVESIK